MSIPRCLQGTAAMSSEKARALNLLKDPASPRITRETGNLCEVLVRLRWRSKLSILAVLVLRASWYTAFVWAGLALLVSYLALGLWPALRVDWPAILISLMVVLTPLVSISIPLAVHTVRERGRLVAEYFAGTCRLKVFCQIAVASLVLAVLSLLCFRLWPETTPPAWVVASVPSVVVGLTMASLLGLGYVLLETLRCTSEEGRMAASRYLAALLVGKAIRGERLDDQLASVYGDLSLLIADADIAAFRALVQMLAQVPRCYTRFAPQPHGLQLDLLWSIHMDVMSHVIGRGAYSPGTSRPGPIAVRFAREHGQILADEFQTCVHDADVHNLSAAARTVQWFYGLLLSSRGDENLPSEVRSELYTLRGAAACHYAMPQTLIESLHSKADPVTQAGAIHALHRGIMDLALDAAERKDHDVVHAVAEGLARLYPVAAMRLSKLGAANDEKDLTYDYWILLGHFVGRAVGGVQGACGAVMVLCTPFKESTPLDLMKTLVSLPQPEWDHPFYAQQRMARGAWITRDPLTDGGVGDAWAIGHPGAELNAAFAFLLARSWRMLQPKPEVIPCSRELGEVKKRLAEILAKPCPSELSVLDQDKAVIHEWLDDCDAAHRAIERHEYLATPLSTGKKQEFEKHLRSGFWQHAVLLEHVPAVISADVNAERPLQWCAIRGSRSLFFGDRSDPDIARLGQDAGTGVATTLHQVVVRKWCGAGGGEPQGPSDTADAIAAAADWIGQAGTMWEGLIVVVGPYELRARVAALPEYQPHAADAAFGREFFGTYRGHPLLWLRTGEDDPTRRLYAFRLSGMREGGAGDQSTALFPTLSKEVYPKVTFKEGRDKGDILVEVDLGYLSTSCPKGRAWNLASATGLAGGNNSP